MKRNWKSISAALLSAAATAAAAAMNRRDDAASTTAHVAQTDTASATKSPTTSGLRATAIAFLSDVLAETYRKIRVDAPRGKR